MIISAYNVQDAINEDLEGLLSHSSYFQSIAYFKIIGKAKDGVTLWVGKDKDGSFLASIIAEKVSEFSFWPLKNLSSRLLIRNWAFGINEEAKIELIIRIIKSQKGVTYSKIKGCRVPEIFEHRLSENGFIIEPHINFDFDLSLGKDELWSNLSSSRRKQIKRGIRRGLTVEILQVVNDGFELTYQLIKNTYKSAGLRVMKEDEFIAIAQGILEDGKLLILKAYKSNYLIGVRLAILNGKTIYDWYAGSDSSYHSYYPNDILVWTLLEWGAQNGYEHFDFGGAGNPNQPYGVREFKKRFGGNLINENIYLYRNKEVSYWLLQVLINFYKNFRKK